MRKKAAFAVDYVHRECCRTIWDISPRRNVQDLEDDDLMALFQLRYGVPSSNATMMPNGRFLHLQVGVR